MKECDQVELIVEKEKYAREGIHKGMVGVIEVDYKIGNEWSVIFTLNAGYDPKTNTVDLGDDVILSVEEGDLRVVRSAGS